MPSKKSIHKLPCYVTEVLAAKSAKQHQELFDFITTDADGPAKSFKTQHKILMTLKSCVGDAIHGAIHELEDIQRLFKVANDHKASIMLLVVLLDPRNIAIETLNNAIKATATVLAQVDF